MISIPISVLSDDGSSDEGFAWSNCDPNTEDCTAAEYDWHHDRQDYIWFNVMAWFRAFDFFNIITFMPTAITQTRLMRGHESAAPKLKMMIKWYSHIGGWVTSACNIAMGVLFIVGHAKDLTGSMLMPLGWSHYNNNNNRNRNNSDEENTGGIAIGAGIIVSEIVGWACYYSWRKGAYRFTQNLIDNFDNSL